MAKRADLVLLVNGIPPVAIEAKTPVRSSESWFDAAVPSVILGRDGLSCGLRRCSALCAQSGSWSSAPQVTCRGLTE